MLKYVGTEKRREKVVVLRELQRAIIYTRELSKQAIGDHVSTAFTVYSANEGARLTKCTAKYSRVYDECTYLSGVLISEHYC
jgi:hypothetical protein